MSVERYISLAEIEYKSGNIATAIRHAENGLATATDPQQIIAFKIFIARAKSKLGKISESNEIYRDLIREKIYMPPVIMGLLHNNLQNPDKAKNNINLLKIFVGSRG